MPDRYARVLRYVRETPWAVLPETMLVIQDLLTMRANGVRFSEDEVRARIGDAVEQRAEVAAARAQAAAGTAVAVLSLRGVIAHRLDAFDGVSGPGGTTVQGFTRAFRQALADDQVGAILIDVDSPGGAVDGVPELAAEIRASRGAKPIVAVANTLAASAAYWIASQADELIVTPSGSVGSIGVFAAHEDVSAFMEMRGIKTTLISAGKFKTETSPFAPLGEEARAALQDRVDGFYGMFVKAVAQGRGVKAKDVRGGFGEGRVVGAALAVAEGMVDSVATFDATLSRLAAGRRKSGDRSQAATVGEIGFEAVIPESADQKGLREPAPKAPWRHPKQHSFT